ncbi:MAG: glycosyltransferase [Conexivisphaerales archaeon]
MKVTMINDCAFVGETLLKYMPTDLDKSHIKRSRGLWSKTFGLAYKVLIAKADIYHVHYLLQDSYMAALFGKRPLIGHAHGSDLRTSLQHPIWGRIVRHNLMHCDKVLVSTPDILPIAKNFREDAEYLPNPVDMQLFYPKPMLEHDGKRRVLIASDSNWQVKGTDFAIRALSKIKDEVEVSIIRHGVDFEKTLAFADSLGLHLNVLPKVSHDKMNQYYWNTDVVIDRFKTGVFGMVSLEAIACGRPAITLISEDYMQYKDIPLKDITTEDRIIDLIKDSSDKLWQKEYEYMISNHKPENVVQKLLGIYQELV